MSAMNIRSARRPRRPLCGVVASRISARDVPIAWPTPSRVTGLTCGGFGTYGDGGHGARGVRLMPRDFAGAALAGLQEYESGHKDGRRHGQDSVNVVVGQQGRLLLDSMIVN